jgi:hypothetical protein
VIPVSDKISPAYFVKLDCRKGNVPDLSPVNAFPPFPQKFRTGEKIFVKVPVAAFAANDFVYRHCLHTPVYFVFGFQDFLYIVKRKHVVPFGIHEMLNSGKQSPVTGPVKILRGLYIIQSAPSRAHVLSPVSIR